MTADPDPPSPLADRPAHRPVRPRADRGSRSASPCPPARARRWPRRRCSARSAACSSPRRRRRPGAATGPIGVTGMLTALVLLSLGVLSTAGEWTHRSVQTTFLLVPQRGRVLAAKGWRWPCSGAAFAAVSAAADRGGAGHDPRGDVAGTGMPRPLATVIAAGAAFAVIGAGIGAALANTPAALTGTYLLLLGVMPVPRTVKPAFAAKIDPANAVLTARHGADQGPGDRDPGGLGRRRHGRRVDPDRPPRRLLTGPHPPSEGRLPRRGTALARLFRAKGTLGEVPFPRKRQQRRGLPRGQFQHEQADVVLVPGRDQLARPGRRRPPPVSSR